MVLSGNVPGLGLYRQELVGDDMEASYVSRTADEDACPECGSSRLVRDYVRGELVCEVCGLVVSENYIDKGPEWTRGDDARTPQTRTGMPSSISTHDKGLTTEISPTHRDSQGNPLPGPDRLGLRRLRRLQKQMRYSRAGEKTLAEALMEMDRMVSVLGLPKEFKREAALIYRKAASRGFVRGRTIRGMVAASIYIACRVLMAPRTFDEVSRQLELEKRELVLSYKAITRGLRLGLQTPKAEDYLKRFASILDLPLEIQKTALNLVRRVEKIDRFHSKAPMGTVAACIYLASLMSGTRISQARIGQVAGVSEVTIRVRYTSIASKLGLDVAPRSQRASVGKPAASP